MFYNKNLEVEGLKFVLAKEKHKFVGGLNLSQIDFNKPIGIFCGRGPSNKFHFGHYISINLIKKFKKKFKIYYQISDDEKITESNQKTIQQESIKIKKIVKKIGFYPFLNSETPELFTYAKVMSKKIKIKEIIKYFGEINQKDIYSIFYIFMQLAAINYIPEEQIIVITGKDQGPYFRLFIDKIKSKKIACLYHDFFPGITQQKMTSQEPDQTIYLNDSDETITKKVKKMKSLGGKLNKNNTLEIDKNRKNCPVLNSIKFFLTYNQFKNKEKKYINGKILTKNLKLELINILRSKKKKFYEQNPNY